MGLPLLNILVIVYAERPRSWSSSENSRKSSLEDQKAHCMAIQLVKNVANMDAASKFKSMRQMPTDQALPLSHPQHQCQVHPPDPDCSNRVRPPYLTRAFVHDTTPCLATPFHAPPSLPHLQATRTSPPSSAQTTSYT